ncbi:MAG: T9SS type A sorting domain-containing protein, partial [Bacteroidota bacterium]
NAMEYYYVTATNSKGCSNNDSIFIEIYYDDISPVALTHDTVCGITDMYPLEVTLKNKGTNILTSNLVTIRYMYDQSNIVTEQFRVNAIPGGTNIYPDETFVYTFDSVIQRNGPGNVDIKVITNLSGDLFTRNDTLEDFAHLLGVPEIQWETASDTLETTFPHTLSLTNTYQAYLWNDASTASTLEVAQEGLYSVTVTAMNQCKAKNSIFVSPVGIEELANDHFDLDIFPVPAHEFINIELNAKSNTNFMLKMYNTQNQLVYVSKYRNKQYISEQLDVRHLSSGLYYLVISGDKGYVLRKIMLE